MGDHDRGSRRGDRRGRGRAGVRSNVAAMAMPKLQVIGGGKMGEALLAGLRRRRVGARGELRVVERLPAGPPSWPSGSPASTSAPTWPPAAGHVLAVKPADVDGACRALAGVGSTAPVLSIAAGVTIARLEAALAPGTPVVRAMPNTPALVGAGAAAVAAGSAGRRGRPGLGRGGARRGGHGRAGRRGAARRRDRAVGLGPRLRVPGGRGADRGRACWPACPGR